MYIWLACRPINENCLFQRFFLYDRELLSDLIPYGWQSLKEPFTALVMEMDAVPGAVIAAQTSDDFLEFQP